MTPSDEHAHAIMDAAHTLIGTVKMTEDDGRAKCAELTVQVETAGGGFETWIIAIERVESKQ